MDNRLLHALAALARDSIHDALGVACATTRCAPPDAFAVPGAAFVTLTRTARLRGCVGTLEAWRPLAEDVSANARAAAFSDPRFPPLTAGELGRTEVEVSVLQAAAPIACDDDATLLAQLRPGVDGLTLRWGLCRATYLPGVWTQLPEPARFVESLRRKAGIPADVDTRELVVERYTTHGSPRLSLAPAAQARGTLR